MTAFDALRLEESAEELLDHAPAGFLSTLADGTVVRVNAAFLRLTGFAREEVLGRRFRELLTPASRAYHDTHMSPLLLLRGWVEDVSLEVQCAGERRLALLVNCNVTTDDEGTPVLVRMVAFDATNRIAFERQLVRARREAELSGRRVGILQRAATAFSQTSTTADVLRALHRILTDEWPVGDAGIWLADGDGLRRTSPPTPLAVRLAPEQVDPLAGLPVGDAIGSRDVVTLSARGRPEADYEATRQCMAADHVALLLAVPLVVEGRAYGAYQVLFRRAPDRWTDDVDLFRTIGVQAAAALQRSGMQEELHHQATHDALTGASNRVLFVEQLDRVLGDAERSGGAVTVMFTDLDGFKAVNDELGHQAGDELLVEVVRRLRTVLRPTDTLARLGGDEFAVLCPGASPKQAQAIASRLERAVRVPFRTHGRDVTVTVSVGIVVHTSTPTSRPVTSGQLLRDADAAMYLAKAGGKNRHVVYDETLDAELTRRAEVESWLRQALDADGIELHYQPVFDLPRDRVVGVEALCRLRAGDGTLVLPDDFIDIAEERGLIVALGARVLELACSQVVGWDLPGTSPLTLAVNVAADQAARADFADEVLAVLARTAFPPHRLLLELTESVLLAATEATLAGLQRLREVGVGIALDDFGTRYASLHYVQQFPLTALKIDRSFVAPLPDGIAERAIVRSVAQLAHDLGLRCTAEGIESDEQREFLTGLGVQGQGYALARPLPADDCRALLSRRAADRSPAARAAVPAPRRSPARG